MGYERATMMSNNSTLAEDKRQYWYWNIILRSYCRIFRLSNCLALTSISCYMLMVSVRHGWVVYLYKCWPERRWCRNEPVGIWSRKWRSRPESRDCRRPRWCRDRRGCSRRAPPNEAHLDHRCNKDLLRFLFASRFLRFLTFFLNFCTCFIFF